MAAKVQNFTEHESSDESWVKVKNRTVGISSAAHFIAPKITTLHIKQRGNEALPGMSALQRNHTYPATSIHHAATSSSSTRLVAIQNELDSLELHSPTPGRASATRQQRSMQNYRVVVVSSDEEDSTDIEPSTRESSFRDSPLSSQSSMDRPFPSLSVVSAPSSHERHPPAIVRNRQISAYSRRAMPTQGRHEPRVVRDVFDTPPAPATHASTIRPNGNALPTPSTDRTQISISETVLQFSRSPFGVDLGAIVIAHNEEAQRILDDNKLAWGVQYELARGVSAGLWEWEAIGASVHRLKGMNVEAAFKVERIMRSQDTSRPADSQIWRQLDLEQDAIVEGRGRGLGLMGEFHGVSDWYGGKIQQIGRLLKDGSSYKIKLERLESRRSYRFARFYGSRRFLRIRVMEDLLRKERDDIKRFFKHKFILCGRVFVPFHAKEQNVYMVETNENYGREGHSWCGDHLRLSLNEFINWHNPLDVGKNTKQVISKYSARFALGLSNSTPALEFSEENILFIDDLTADDWPKHEKGAPADKLMTDGCGFLNHAALHAIVKAVGYESVPAGVQGRIDGSKGFFILHPTDRSTIPKVWIRDSQNKIQNRSFDRAHRIFDLLCASQVSSPQALTQQIIINLFANGIPANLLVELMEQGLEDEVAPLLDWDKQNASLFLYNAISKCGGVPGTRTQRVSYALNRVLGFSGRDWHDNDGRTDEDMDNDDDSEPYTGRNNYSGAPFALHEVAIELLQSGFSPRDNKLLQEKVFFIVKSIIESSVEKYRIPIPESVGAFIVPDPLGILEEGEVCYRFSQPRKDPTTEMLMYALEGEILLGRYPIRLPSDVQRVIAVHRRELDQWPDVLIVSVKGKRSIASLLADGDMDGDEIIGIYNKDLVQRFNNQAFTHPPKDFLKANFQRDVESVEQFCNRVLGLQSTREAQEAFQDTLISNLSESRVGLYSMMHENACIRHGYDSQQAIRLAYIFATLLDSSKNGCRLKDNLFTTDSRSYGNPLKQISNQNPGSNAMEDILNILKIAARKKGEELLQKYRDLGELDDWIANDVDLRRPIDDARKTARKYAALGFEGFSKELEAIDARVEEAYKIYLNSWSGYFSNKSQESPAKKSGKSRKPTDVMLECAKKFAEPIPGLDFIQNRHLEDIKASCAYAKRPKFSFQVAFRNLCLLKADASPGGLVPIVRMFDEAKKVTPSYLRALEWAEDDNVRPGGED